MVKACKKAKLDEMLEKKEDFELEEGVLALLKYYLRKSTRES